MISSAIRVSGLGAARVARQNVAASASRAFATTNYRQADLVQDLYLKELRAYKIPTVKPSDSQGHVQQFTAPKAPKSPEEADLASQLKEYESQQVEVEGQATESAAADGSHAGPNWFEEMENFDEPEDAHH